MSLQEGDVLGLPSSLALTEGLGTQLALWEDKEASVPAQHEVKGLRGFI